MTNKTLDELRGEALTLPALQRAELANDLVSSLDGPPDADAADRWTDEINSRVARVDAGTGEMIDIDVFLDDLKRVTRSR